MEERIRSFFSVATRRAGDRQALDERAAIVREALWLDLQQDGASLQEQGHGLRRPSAHQTVSATRRTLADWLKHVRDALTAFGQALPESGAQKDKETKAMRIGLGGLGRAGCSDNLGRNVNLVPLLHPEHGIVAAAVRLNLDVIGMTGARLACESRSIGNGEFNIFGRWAGGTSYASVAVLWRESSVSLTVRRDIGSKRQLWVETDGGPFASCTFHRPTTMSG